MKILLFGKNGQVGWELQRSLSVLGELLALDRYSENFCGDLTNLAGILNTIVSYRPDVIVNAAAYTAVDAAEIERDKSWLINVEAVKIMAEQSRKLGALFIHYSSDYVFSGEASGCYDENAETKAVNFYGETKVEGEKIIVENNPHHLIFRTSWVHSARGNNFIKTIMKLAQDKKEISVIDDQIGTPTSAELIADCTAHAIKHVIKNKNNVGIYHLVPDGNTSWFEYAKLIVDNIPATQNKIQQVKKIPSTQYKTLAKRPQNSRMANTKFQNTFDLRLPSWRFGVERTLTEIIDGIKVGNNESH